MAVNPTTPTAWSPSYARRAMAGSVTSRHSIDASERAPASEWPATDCVAGERNKWSSVYCRSSHSKPVHGVRAVVVDVSTLEVAHTLGRVELGPAVEHAIIVDEHRVAWLQPERHLVGGIVEPLGEPPPAAVIGVEVVLGARQRSVELGVEPDLAEPAFTVVIQHAPVAHDCVGQHVVA